MHFDTYIPPEEISVAGLHRFISLIGVEILKKHTDKMQRQNNPNNPALMQYMLDYHGLEIALINVIKHKKSTGRIPAPKTADEHRLRVFIASILRVYDHLSEPARIKLSGMVKGSFDQSNGFSSLAFEMQVAGFFMSSGFDVNFCDLEDTEKFDFLVSKGKDLIEVECKFVSPDIGRKIHLKNFCILIDKLKPIIESHSEVLVGGIYIDIEFSDRFDNNDVYINAIAESVKIFLETDEHTPNDVFALKAEKFSLNEISFNENNHGESARDFIENRFKKSVEYLSAAGRNGKSAILLSLSSKKPNTTLDSIYDKHLSKAAKQLSGTRAGTIFLYFPEYSKAEPHSIAEPDTGHVKIVTEILRKNTHIHGVSLWMGGNVVQKFNKFLIAPAITQEIGIAHSFINPDCILRPPTENIFNQLFKK